MSKDEKNKAENPTNSQKIWAIVKEIVETVVIVLVLVILIRNFIGEPRWIPSASMRPTLMEGDRLIIEKVSSHFTEPKRGDILVFYPPDEKLSTSPWARFTRLVGYFNNDKAYIKRVVGVPGDKFLYSEDKGVLINGKPIKETYLNESFNAIRCMPGMYCGPFVVPKDSYFMMGDNRNNSQDSRFWGVLPEKRIIGKAYFRFWPIDRVGLIKHPKY